MSTVTALQGQTALITGSARRIGAVIARRLHAEGMNLALHYRASAADAVALADDLNGRRPDSVLLLSAELRDTDRLPALVEQAAARWGRLDLLVNNASSYYPTPLGAATPAHWDDLLGSNLKAPFFLAQAAAPWLQAQHGSIINMVDIYARHPSLGYSIYCAAKAGLIALTQALALELAPAVRVNGIAPGAILWPDQGLDPATQAHKLARIPLQRSGEPDDIATALLFLVRDAGYVTGQILTVDGGRTLSI